MELSEGQKSSVASWFAGGMSLDEIQKRIRSEFGIHMTYLDLRLLVADLPQPEEKVVEQAVEEGDMTDRTPKTPRTEPPDGNQDFAEGDADSGEADAAEGAPEGDASNERQAATPPTVTIDAIMIPGTLASGDVTFSDGKTGKWYLDQMGRLGIGQLPEGYRPSPTDAALFQQQLMSLLQSKGLC